MYFIIRIQQNVVFYIHFFLVQFTSSSSSFRPPCFHALVQLPYSCLLFLAKRLNWKPESWFKSLWKSSLPPPKPYPFFPLVNMHIVAVNILYRILSPELKRYPPSLPTTYLFFSPQLLYIMDVTSSSYFSSPHFLWLCSSLLLHVTSSLPFQLLLTTSSTFKKQQNKTSYL